MTETLVQAYTPLILWIGLGLLLFRFLPQWLPHFLGRSLYWLGVPLQLIALARRGNHNQLSGSDNLPILASLITFGALFLGLVVALLVWWGWQQILPYLFKSELSESVSHPLQDSSSKGSFLLAAVLGNTGFVGLAIAPYLVHVDALNWVVLFSITHNVIGPYGLGVLIASYFSHTKSTNHFISI